MKKKTFLTLFLVSVLVICCFTGCKKEVIVRPVETSSPSSAPNSAPSSEAASYPVELSSSELGNFETALNDQSNYGFLLSDYDDVRDVDLAQVFYLGAGLPAPSNADEIRNAELAARSENPDVDSTILTASQISDFLYEKTGYSLADMSSSLTWSYVGEYDAYVHWHGDTNYVSSTCTGGRQISADTYEIEYELSGGFYDNSGNELTGGMVTVRVANNTLQFISNAMH